MNLVNLVVHFSSLELKGLTFNPLDFAIWYWFSCIISVIQSVWKRLQHLLHLGFKFCFYFAFSAANFENQIETSRCKSELHQGEANKLCSHLGSNFELIRGSPPPHSFPTPLANFHSPTLPDTGYHWSSSIRWLTCFERLELLVSTLYLQFRWKKKTFVIYVPHENTKSRQKQSAAFPTVLHLTSHAWPNGPPSWERRGLMKNKFMDVEQPRHTDISGINEEFIPSRCFFLPELFLEEPFQGTVTVKRAPLHVWQRESAHVSNSITQTSCIPRLLLASPRVAASPSWPRKSLALSVASEENGGKTCGSADLHLFFTRFLICTSSWFTKTHIQSDGNHHPGPCRCSKAAECRFRSWVPDCTLSTLERHNVRGASVSGEKAFLDKNSDKGPILHFTHCYFMICFCRSAVDQLFPGWPEVKATLEKWMQLQSQELFNSPFFIFRMIKTAKGGTNKSSWVWTSMIARASYDWMENVSVKSLCRLCFSLN